MKRIICLLLSAAFFLFLFGCENDSKANAQNFYYPRNDLGYHKQEGKFSDCAVEAEQRSDIPYQSDIQILGEYLKGPLDPSLYNPFPTGLRLVALDLQEEVLYLTVSDHLARLRDIPLMIACTCLAKTAMTLTNTATVQVSCQTSLLNGEKYIILHAEDIIFEDPIITEPDQ